MTATITSTDQAVSEWIKVFPRQAAENYTGSVTFMKQLTVVAVSIITYVKNIFPNDDYILENFGGLNLHILKKKCNDDIAQFLSNAMIQAFDAFDKKYLHKFALCFYEDEFKPENLIDYLIFEYSYNDDTVTMNVHSRNKGSLKETTKYTFENVRYRTIKMIRSIMVALSDDNYNPSSYEICLRLYYNEDAPADYQAPGFVDGKESEDHIDPTTQELIPLGSVETPFHKIVTKAYKREQGCTSREPLPSQSAPVLHSSNETNCTEESARSVSEIDIQLSCICKRYDGDDLISANELLTCQYCNTQQHAVCYGVLREHTPYIQHCCHACYMNDNTRTPTDKKTASAERTKKESFAMFRRVVEFCTQIPAVNAQTLVETMRITKINAEKLMMLLHLHGIVKNEPNIDNTLQNIIIEKVQDLRSRLFNTPETLTLSQESASVTDILSPFKNVSLQRKATASRVPQKQDDPMLKQYRDALHTTNNIEEPETNIVESVKKSVKRKLSRDKSRRSGIQTKKIKSLPK